MIKITPIVLCGGTGTRLWPISRAEYPKQFINISHEKESLYQQTLQRLESLEGKGIEKNETIIVTSETHRFLAAQQSHEVKGRKRTIILEPSSRNTAPALTLAALHSAAKGEDPVLFVSPADHLITRYDGTGENIYEAIIAASRGSVVVFGVAPKYPETNYGYIHTKKVEESHLYNVIGFSEKPTLLKAKEYLQSGRYFWNAGIVVIKASVWIRLIKEYNFDLYLNTLKSWENKTIEFDFIKPALKDFEKIKPDSIDYAVLEKINALNFDFKLIKFPGEWKDLGTWEVTSEILHSDNHGNRIHGDIVSVGAKNNLLYSTNRLVAVAGIEDIMVIETNDVVLVCKQRESPKIKSIVDTLIQNGREEGIRHRRVNRPWGWYDTVDSGRNFKVKRIVVNVGQSLSLQSHEHRSEHWVVVTGTATVLNGETALLLKANESTYIQKNAKHRLSNVGDIPLEIIEIQVGEILDEQDIKRFSDNYGRAPR